MGAITTIVNRATIINIPADFSDGGWEISNSYAIHRSCNAGYVKLLGSLIEVGKTYHVEYKVFDYISGGVKIMFGTTSGTTFNSAGLKDEDIVVADNTDIKFYSDGNLSIEYLSVYEVVDMVDNGITLVYSEDVKRFVTYLSWRPEMMLRFIDTFFSFSGGTLWEHHTNEIRCNFYGVQYKARVTFYVNINPDAVKLFYSIRIESDHVWAAPTLDDIVILPTKGKSDGMKSRLKKGNFHLLQGEFFADFLRNMLDPRFNTQLSALFNGAELRGKIMEITLENEDTEQVVLTKVDVTTAPSKFTY